MIRSHTDGYNLEDSEDEDFTPDEKARKILKDVSSSQETEVLEEPHSPLSPSSGIKAPPSPGLTRYPATFARTTTTPNSQSESQQSVSVSTYAWRPFGCAD